LTIFPCAGGLRCVPVVEATYCRRLRGPARWAPGWARPHRRRGVCSPSGCGSMERGRSSQPLQQKARRSSAARTESGAAGSRSPQCAERPRGASVRGRVLAWCTARAQDGVRPRQRVLDGDVRPVSPSSMVEVFTSAGSGATCGSNRDGRAWFVPSSSTFARAMAAASRPPPRTTRPAVGYSVCCKFEPIQRV
jgi:hypothetical protein